MAAKKPSKKFTPWTMPSLPPGSYDPGLDAQWRAAQRGYTDLTGRNAAGDMVEPLSSDLGRQQTRADIQQGWGLSDLLTNFNRSSADLDENRRQTRQGYDRSLADLL